MRVGERLREARRIRRLSLRGLGALTGFSASFLSQVELGQASPSLASLQRIADALGVTVASVVASPGRVASALLRRTDRAPHRSEWSSATLEPLVGGAADEKLQAVLIRLEVAGKTGATTYGPGRRLFAYCTAGDVRILLSDPAEELVATTGDSIVVEGPRAVGFENGGQGPAEVVVVTAKIA